MLFINIYHAAELSDEDDVIAVCKTENEALREMLIDKDNLFKVKEAYIKTLVVDADNWRVENLKDEAEDLCEDVANNPWKYFS